MALSLPDSEEPETFEMPKDHPSVWDLVDSMQGSETESLKKTFGFTVAVDFPKIVKSQLPLGIYNTSYSIELSAVEKFIILTLGKNPRLQAKTLVSLLNANV